jgi:hypothetical protein
MLAQFVIFDIHCQADISQYFLQPRQKMCTQFFNVKYAPDHSDGPHTINGKHTAAAPSERVHEEIPPGDIGDALGHDRQIAAACKCHGVWSRVEGGLSAYRWLPVHKAAYVNVH